MSEMSGPRKGGYTRKVALDRRPEKQTRFSESNAAAKRETIGGIDIASLKGLLAETRDFIIPLAGKIIFGSLQSISKDQLCRFDFSGADLTQAQLGITPLWPAFKYDANTKFPDTLGESLIKSAEKRTGIKMQLIDVTPTAFRS